MKRKAKAAPVKSKGTKRKEAPASDPVVDVEADVQDIEPSSQKRKIGGKKIPPNVPFAPLDNVSFHTEKSAQKWRYVYQSRIAREIELHADALK